MPVPRVGRESAQRGCLRLPSSRRQRQDQQFLVMDELRLSQRLAALQVLEHRHCTSHELRLFAIDVVQVGVLVGFEKSSLAIANIHNQLAERRLTRILRALVLDDLDHKVQRDWLIQRTRRAMQVAWTGKVVAG